jgi:hypothetical protein
MYTYALNEIRRAKYRELTKDSSTQHFVLRTTNHLQLHIRRRDYDPVSLFTMNLLAYFRILSTVYIF